MKSILLTTLFLLIAGSLRAELNIISTEHRDVSSFKRISEYFTGKENTGRYFVRRTQPENRTGFYISLLAKDKDALASVAAIRLQFVRSGTQEVETVDMPVTETIDRKRLLVGMTESEWEDPNARPVAWKIEILDANQRPIDSAESFLWAKPID